MTYGTHRLNRSLWGEAEQSEAVPGVSVRDAFIAIRLGCIEEADAILRRSLVIYGVGGIIAPFLGIKVIDLALAAFHLV